MPIYDKDHMEYSINSGQITIVLDDGSKLPAYWSHPQLGTRFAGIALLHDWWGVNHTIRMLADFFAQMGYYVIVPDLYDGEVAKTPKEAMALLEKYQETRFMKANTTLAVLEQHHLCNASVAAVGVGMGGTLAFEAAIKRDDLEAAVAFAGFPQSYLGKFSKSNTPIFALYGSEEPHVKPVVVKAMMDEFDKTDLKDQHHVLVVDKIGREFFDENASPESRDNARKAMSQVLKFLEDHLEQPKGLVRNDEVY